MHHAEHLTIPNTLAVRQLITISKQRFTGGYFFRGESHNSYEAICVLEGSVGITAGKRIFTLSAGQMTIHRPLEFHAIWEQESSRPTCIIFSFSASAFPKLTSYLYRMSDERIGEIEALYAASRAVFEIAPHPTLEQAGGAKTVYDHGEQITGIRAEMAHEAFRFAKRLEILLSAVLEAPLDTPKVWEDAAGENYKKILEVMEAHLDEGLRLSDIARLCHISVPTVEKTVHKYLQCGAMEYYQNRRMNKALRLLGEGESVKNVAALLHFSTQHYFSLAFKKHFGYPPSGAKNTGKNI